MSTTVERTYTGDVEKLFDEKWRGGARGAMAEDN
jgi:hypothetical protein